MPQIVVYWLNNIWDAEWITSLWREMIGKTWAYQKMKIKRSSPQIYRRNDVMSLIIVHRAYYLIMTCKYMKLVKITGSSLHFNSQNKNITLYTCIGDYHKISLYNQISRQSKTKKNRYKKRNINQDDIDPFILKQYYYTIEKNKRQTINIKRKTM